MIRRTALALGLVALAACGAPKDLPDTPEPIGDFRLGFNVVVAPDAAQAPASRPATEEDLVSTVRAAMEQRLGRYDGDGLYHIGLKVEAYSLGRTGIPIVFSPRSAMILAMNIWDDATQEKLNDEPIRITAFEGEAGPLIGSGLVKTGDEQLAALAFDTAKEVEKILIENRDLWFADKPGRERVPFRRDPETGLAAEGPGPARSSAAAAASAN